MYILRKNEKLVKISEMVNFKVVCLVTWPLGGSGARVALMLIQTSCFSDVNHFVLVLTSLQLHVKSRRVYVN